MKKNWLAFVFTCLAVTANAATPISEKYAQLGGSGGFLGSSTTTEKSTPDGVGRFQHFQHGSLYYHPQTWGHEVHGMIRNRWAELGWELGFLGYPMTDEVELVDGTGRVTKFQGGEIRWFSATNSVTVVKSSDLVVDLPFPVGVPWTIIQANGLGNLDEHHVDAWAYCWDFVLANGVTEGQPFVASADANVVYVTENLNGEDPDNVVIQKFGEGRYGSYLHLAKGGYTKKIGGKGIVFLPQDGGVRLMNSGTVLGEIGTHNHLHFCVTTAPDRNPVFFPFESVPVAFRNYSFSTNQGKTWTYVPVGVPRRDQWLRREPAKSGIATKPQVSGAVSVISHGTVSGKIFADGHPPGKAKGKITISIVSQWNEELLRKTIDVDSSTGPPWTFTITSVPAYPGLKVVAQYEGAWNLAFDHVHGEGAKFNLAPNGTATTSVTLKTTLIH
jgi:hypothetical protein